VHFRRKLRVVAEPEVDDASVRLVEANHTITEVAIVCDENAALGMGNLEDLRVVQSPWVVAFDPGGVIPVCVAVVDEAGIGTLIQEEPHIVEPLYHNSEIVK